MPVIKTHENKIYTSVEMINKIISPHWITLFDITDDMRSLASTKVFNDELKQKLMSSLPIAMVDEYRKMNLMHTNLFIARSELKNELDPALNEYEQMHMNNYNEIHHIINGSVRFGFVNSDGNQSVVILLPGEKIFIKENSEHWGTVTDDYYATLISCKSVAYSHRIANKSGTPVLFRF